MFRVRNRVRVRIRRIGFRQNWIRRDGIRRNGAEPGRLTIFFPKEFKEVLPTAKSVQRGSDSIEYIIQIDS